MGSPPHTRGKEISGGLDVVPVGITPAHAGKSGPARRPPYPEWDHPRTRGEKKLCERLHTGCQGSPPHTRGKDASSRKVRCIGRITPAHAGKSSKASLPTTWTRDHPRTRGEKSSQRFQGEANSGSPPHTRGKGIQQLAGVYQRGITPAHAGKRGDALFYISAERDHPRTRGEKIMSSVFSTAITGSPPRVRGKGYIGERK